MHLQSPSANGASSAALLEGKSCQTSNDLAVPGDHTSRRLRTLTDGQTSFIWPNFVDYTPLTRSTTLIFQGIGNQLKSLNSDVRLAAFNLTDVRSM